MVSASVTLMVIICANLGLYVLGAASVFEGRVDTRLPEESVNDDDG